MNKKALTEADIRSKSITPALVGPNGGKWNLMTQIREEAFFTPGRVIVRGKTVTRGKAKKADYILSYGIKARAVLDALLAKYADGGLRSVESLEILKVEPLTTFGAPVEIVTLFGGKPAYLAALRELKTALYQEAA